MKFIPKMIIAVISGALAGAALLFIVIVAAVGYAYTTNSSINLPGIIQAWFTAENGLPALNFNPNFTGMAVWICIVAAVFSFVTWRGLRSTASNKPKFHD